MKLSYEDAVSPVVGVMLMLAVTVMVAALVSGYAGGFSGGTDKTPQSSIRAVPSIDQQKIYFEHNGGDPFMLSSVQVAFRANESKTTLSVIDAGSQAGKRVRNFTEVGNNDGTYTDTTIQAGDTFYITALDGDNKTWMKFGSMNLTTDSRITWLVVDKETSKTISSGSFYL
ncbi:type IV pilin N-terminal domain-containing protein [Methanoregula sp.]|uniref:type IV pilin N-terminal domain-containing protein n=1 Tax=Methanoregula sp. TaxID=2052170 RepID=UPI002370EDF8|nr:type IV pilin N-terminal domain-containing protein [Methanoregula sp.]MDD1687325.1 type IV pilin N-terminal domain-containing protein [Methanoregula sp.]